MVEFACTNPVYNIKHVDHPERECECFYPKNSELNDKNDECVLTIPKEDLFRKSADILCDMILDSEDRSYNYKLVFIEGIDKLTKYLIPKDDEKE